MVEGILIFADKTLRDLLDVKIFVDTDSDIRLIRRLERDILKSAAVRPNGCSPVHGYRTPDAPGICRTFQTLRRRNRPRRRAERSCDGNGRRPAGIITTLRAAD